MDWDGIVHETVLLKDGRTPCLTGFTVVGNHIAGVVIRFISGMAAET